MIRSSRSGLEGPVIADRAVEVTVEVVGAEAARTATIIVAFGSQATDEAVADEVAIQARALYREVMLVARRG